MNQITLDNILDTPLQDIFDAVTEHMLNQKTRSLGPDGKGAYRSPTGEKCGLGIFITDEQYEESFEGQNIGSILGSRQKEEDRPKTILLRKELANLQRIHDVVPVAMWKGCLKNFAFNNKLNFKSV